MFPLSCNSSVNKGPIEITEREKALISTRNAALNKTSAMVSLIGMGYLIARCYFYITNDCTHISTIKVIDPSNLPIADAIKDCFSNTYKDFYKSESNGFMFVVLVASAVYFTAKLLFWSINSCDSYFKRRALDSDDQKAIFNQDSSLLTNREKFLIKVNQAANSYQAMFASLVLVAVTTIEASLTFSRRTCWNVQITQSPRPGAHAIGCFDGWGFYEVEKQSPYNLENLFVAAGFVAAVAFSGYSLFKCVKDFTKMRTKQIAFQNDESALIAQTLDPSLLKDQLLKKKVE